jgi:hypothetical protein
MDSHFWVPSKCEAQLAAQRQLLVDVKGRQPLWANSLKVNLPKANSTKYWFSWVLSPFHYLQNSWQFSLAIFFFFAFLVNFCEVLVDCFFPLFPDSILKNAQSVSVLARVIVWPEEPWSESAHSQRMNADWETCHYSHKDSPDWSQMDSVFKYTGQTEHRIRLPMWFLGI